LKSLSRWATRGTTCRGRNRAFGAYIDEKKEALQHHDLEQILRLFGEGEEFRIALKLKWAVAQALATYYTPSY